MEGDYYSHSSLSASYFGGNEIANTVGYHRV